MAEILVIAANKSHVDPNRDRAGCYKRGMPVIVQQDGHQWGLKERLPLFVVIKIPGVSVARVLKYAQEHKIDLGGEKPEIYRRRRWIIRWDDLPQRAKNRLRDDGELIIAPGAQGGDYTWAQVKSYFRNQETGLDETEDL